MHSETEQGKPGLDITTQNGNDLAGANDNNGDGDDGKEERDPNLFDTFVSPLSLQAALRAAGAVCSFLVK